MLSPIENILLFLLVFSLMIGIGCSLEQENFKTTLREKKPFLIGLLLQYISMPLLAIGLISLGGIDGLMGYTILLVACCPGGTTSNMFTFLSKGNTELSIVLTLTTTILSFVMTPLLLGIYGRAIIEDSSISIPLKNIVVSLVFVLIPIFLGYLIKQRNTRLAERVDKVSRKFGHISMLIMIFIWLPKLAETIKDREIKLFVVIGLLSLLGIGVSFLMTKFLKLAAVNQRALSFETGIQNAPLAFAILMLSYPKDTALSVSWIPLLYGALSVGNSILFTIFFMLSAKKKPLD